MASGVWTEHRSRRYPQRVYYYNSITKTSTWEKPPELLPEDNPENKADPAAVKTDTSPGKGVLQYNMNTNNSKHFDSSADTPTLSSAIPGSAESSAPTAAVTIKQVLHAGASLPCVSSVEVDDSVMEWEERWGEDEEVVMDVDVNEEEVDCSVQSARTSLTLTTSLEVFNLPRDESPLTFSDTLFLVLDTNVLISHLQFLMELKDYAIKGVGQPILVVPWVVMQELDALKSRSSIQTKVRKAISSLNSCFTAGHPRVRGQTLEEVQTEMKSIGIQNNDDKILHCCLVYRAKAVDGIVVLFSNDIQLCSKAMINGITALNRKTLLMELRTLCKQLPARSSEVYKTSNSGFAEEHKIPGNRQLADRLLCEAEGVARTALATAIQRVMIEAYGDKLWKEIVLVKPPWTLKDVIYLLDKHYLAVFNTILPIHSSATSAARKALLDHTRNRDAILPTFEDVDKFTENALFITDVFSKHYDCEGVLSKGVETLTTIKKEVSEAKKRTLPISFGLSGQSSLATDDPSLTSTHSSTSLPSTDFPSCASISSGRTATVEVQQTPKDIESLYHPPNTSLPIDRLPIDSLQWAIHLVLQGMQKCRLQLEVVMHQESSYKEGAIYRARQICNLLAQLVTSLSSLVSLGYSMPRMQDAVSILESFIMQVANVSTPVTMDAFYTLCTMHADQTRVLLQTALQQFQVVLAEIHEIIVLISE